MKSRLSKAWPVVRHETKPLSTRTKHLKCYNFLTSSRAGGTAIVAANTAKPMEPVYMDHSSMDHGHMGHGDMDMGGDQCSMNVSYYRLLGCNLTDMPR